MVDIISADGDGTLKLERADTELRVTMTSPGVSATIDVAMWPDASVSHDPWADLAAFFRDLARNWMESPAQLRYGAADEPFALSCDWDNAGHFHLRVRLCETRHAEWSVTGRVELELGTLDGLCARIGQLAEDATVSPAAT